MEFKARIYLMCKNGKHKYGAWKVTYKPTCSETGTKKRVCKKCHFEKEAKIKATGKHVYGEWEEEKATCENEGYKLRYLHWDTNTMRQPENVKFADNIKITKYITQV